MVKSRDLPAAERPQVQERFTTLMDQLNDKYSTTLLSRFVITLGDEFQGLISSGTVIPDLLWDMSENFSDRELRIGIGLGQIHTQIPRYAMNLDGPALHRARAALNQAKRARALGGVFNGFGDLDVVLNGLARILWWHRAQLTPNQVKTLALLRQGKNQSEVAGEFRVTRQTISHRAISAGTAVRLTQKLLATSSCCAIS
jgi:hypothetical protein